MKKIKNVVFDIGRVLVHYNPEKIIDNLAPGTAHKQAYLDTLFHAPLWQEMDRGDVSHQQGKDILSEMVDHHPEKARDLHLFLDDFVYHLDLIDGTKSIFLELHSQSFDIYLLSNFQDIPFDRLLEENPFLTHAKGMAVSGKLNMMKPEPEIYDYLLDTHNLDAEQTVFIDDLEENIAAAVAKGIHGIVFHSPDRLLDDLEAIGITLPVSRQSVT